MAHLPPAEQIEQSYDLTMMALAHYSRASAMQRRLSKLIRIVDRDRLRDAITEVLVDSRVHPRPKTDVPTREHRPLHDRVDLPSR